MLGKVFKAYDVRATYPKPLNEKLAWQIGYGSAQYLMEQAENAGHDDPMMRHIVVGHDMRKSSPKLADALKQGIKDFESGTYQGIAIPNGMNKVNAEKLATALIAVIRIPELRAKLAAAGAEVMTSTPKETSEFLTAEAKRWSGLIQRAGNQLEGNA